MSPIPRLRLLTVTALLATLATAQRPMPAKPSNDPFLWLEDVDGERQLDWVRARNAESQQALTGGPRFQALRDRVLSILED